MDPRTFPTKGNLMLAKNSLALARQGYDLMDKKRNILIRELMDLIEEARTIQEEINSGLILLGVTGIVQPTVSALLHNASTLMISLGSMKNLLDENKRTEHE